MKVDERALKDVHTVGGGETPPCVGLTSNTLPKAQSTVSAESSQTGVSTRNAHIAVKPKAQKEENVPHWYALRTTYGREKKAYDYMTAKGITAFYPTIDTVKLINGKRKVVTESRLPNIFSTCQEMQLIIAVPMKRMDMWRLVMARRLSRAYIGFQNHWGTTRLSVIVTAMLVATSIC